MKSILTALLVVSLFSTAQPVVADVGDNEVRIATRALSFLDKPLTGAVRVGIVVASDNPLSVRDATALQKIMSGGPKVGSLSLTPVIVPIENIDGANVDLLFLSEGLGPRAIEAGNFGRAKRIPCITFDIEQVRNGNCAIGIRSNPRIEILANHNAASRSGVNFAGAFKMLVTEF